MNTKKLYTVACGIALSAALSACGNPGGISKEDYAKYQKLGAPKILYVCSNDKNPDGHMLYGKGATYNDLIEKAESSCSGHGEAKILESEK